MTLLILIENLVNAVDDGKCAVGIFVDLKEAFHTGVHCILLAKSIFMESVAWRLIGFPVICIITKNCDFF